MTASLFSGRRSSERSLCLHQLMIRDPVRFNTEISSQAGSILPTQSRRDSVQFDWQQTAGLYEHCFKYGVVVQPEVLFWYLLLVVTSDYCFISMASNQTSPFWPLTFDLSRAFPSTQLQLAGYFPVFFSFSVNPRDGCVSVIIPVDPQCVNHLLAV